MANKVQISQLPTASAVGDDDLLVVSQSGVASKATGAQVFANRIDSTLSIAGKAADAAAVGTQIGNLKSALGVTTELNSSDFTWTLGRAINTTTGNEGANAANALSKLTPAAEGDIIESLVPNTGVDDYAQNCFVCLYADNVFSSRVQVRFGERCAIPSGINGFRFQFGYASNTGITLTQEMVDTYFSVRWYRRMAAKSELDGAVTEINQSCFQYRGALQPDTDPDTLQQPGYWRWLEANTPSSFPIHLSGMLEYIGPVDAVSFAIQRITYANERVFVRWKAAYGWHEWSEITPDSKIALMPTRIFERRIAFFGASEIYGTNGDGGERTPYKIPDTISQMLKVTCDNLGVGGMGFIRRAESTNQTAYEKISSTDLSPYDTIIMIFGGNDGFNPVGTYDSTDESTCLGQFNKIVNYIYTQKPAVRLIVVSPLNGRNAGSFPSYWYGNVGSVAYSRGLLSDTLKQACEYYNIPYIEQTTSPINGYTIQTLIGSDGVHPSNEGYQRIGEWLAGQLSTLIG